MQSMSAEMCVRCTQGQGWTCICALEGTCIRLMRVDIHWGRWVWVGAGVWIAPLETDRGVNKRGET